MISKDCNCIQRSWRSSKITMISKVTISKDHNDIQRPQWSSKTTTLSKCIMFRFFNTRNNISTTIIGFPVRRCHDFSSRGITTSRPEASRPPVPRHDDFPSWVSRRLAERCHDSRQRVSIQGRHTTVTIDLTAGENWQYTTVLYMYIYIWCIRTLPVDN